MAISIEDVPPAYHEVVAALSKAVESDPKAAHKALADSFKKESSNILVKQSRDLTDTITTLKKLFESISLNLIRVDQVLTVGGPRRPTWDKIYEDYKVLVNETKEDAISVKSFAEKYLESVLTAAQDTDLTIDEKIREIDSFLAEVKKHAENAKDYSQRFLDIKDRVFEFRAKLIGDFDTGKDELQDKVDKCKQDIIKLEEDLAHWEKIVSYFFF
ncbi:hypothetical protein SCHPADRAFT_422279 [Schizopora paradoxa]|uniref:Uncharacterized protein n=1 Tax=Schizopora paradoxa TaxID=27342 RepID=A0A0H2RSD8_9AGAM|nr:hypothetical protein SCHPADRAFT_422279 [Schizopora paradoxa]